jgi:hypothetical protein
MKKVIIILLAGLYLCLLASCFGARDIHEKELLDADDVFMAYDVNADTFFLFDVDDDGVVYVTFFSLDCDCGVSHPEGTKNTIVSYGLDGYVITDFDVFLNGAIEAFTVGENALYFIAFAEQENRVSSICKTLYRYDLDTQTLETLYTFSRFDFMHDMAYFDGVVYIMGRDPQYLSKPFDVWPGTRFYNYLAYILIAYDIDKGTYEVIHDSQPHTFSVTPDGRVLIHAHDGEEGWYFIYYDPSDLSFGEKIYRNFDGIDRMASDGEGIIFSAFTNAVISSGQAVLRYMAVDTFSGVADVMPNTFANKIVYKKGFTFYIRSTVIDDRTFRFRSFLERIRNDVYIKTHTTINLLAPGRFGGHIFSSGFNIHTNFVDFDVFALSVLSRDRNHDIWYLNSRNDFSMNIRDKGAFYPLNDVPMVMEFLNRCHPYIKEAATDGEGNIWMLPISVDMQFIQYHEANMANAGLSFGEAETLLDMIEILETIRETANTQFYNVNTFGILNNAVNMYLRDNQKFDTPEFRQLAPVLHRFFNDGREGNFNIGERFRLDRNFGGLLNSFIGGMEIAVNQIQIDMGLRAASITGSVDKTSASVILLAVNPESRNLAATLDFISALCRYFMDFPNFLMFADSANYTDIPYIWDLREIYANGFIEFTMPFEIFYNDLLRYKRSEITLDDFITEADRKLTMYLNE